MGGTSNTDTKYTFDGFDVNLGSRIVYVASDITKAKVKEMKFKSTEKAKRWYNMYSKSMGFSIRKTNTKPMMVVQLN